jgi:hypothetical protein
VATGLAPRTVGYVHAVLRRALGQAADWGLVGRNVAGQVHPPRARRADIRPLTVEQAAALLAGDRWREHGLVFSIGRGTPLQPRNLLRHFQETIARGDGPGPRCRRRCHAGPSTSCATWRRA